jgi:hypothetical protein
MQPTPKIARLVTAAFLAYTTLTLAQAPAAQTPPVQTPAAQSSAQGQVPAAASVPPTAVRPTRRGASAPPATSIFRSSAASMPRA